MRSFTGRKTPISRKTQHREKPDLRKPRRSGILFLKTAYLLGRRRSMTPMAFNAGRSAV